MRRSFSIFVIAALGTFTVLTASAQKSKSFAGTVKISIRYEGNTNPRDHAPVETVYTILGNKQKVVMPQASMTQILDGDAVRVTALFDIPGYKSGYRMEKEEFEEKMERYKYTYTKKGDTMTVCGYLCTRYDVSIYDAEEDEETTVILYTTTEIGENSNINVFEFPGLTGFPLYRESESKGVKTIVKAVEVKPSKKVKPVDFLTPSGYKMFPNQMEWIMFIQAAFGGGE